MLSPEFLLHISEPAEEIAEQLHQDILNRIIERIMIRLGRGEDYILSAVDKWQIEVLEDAGYLLEDIQREIAKRTKLQQTEIAEAMEDAGVRALSYDDAIYKAAGLSPVPLTQSPYLMRLMQSNYERTIHTWDNFTRTFAEASQREFINVCDRAFHLVSTGTISYTQAVKEAVNSISGGIYVNWTDSNGNVYHRDTIETATLRCVRTGISQATGSIQMARMNEMDWDTILVSAHLGARTGDGGENPTNHAWWQGKFYSKSGRDKRFPPFSVTGYQTGEGLCGWNCRHSFGCGDGENNPFEHYDSEENQKAYELQQRQRTLERRIRKTKREVMSLKTSIDAEKDEKLKFALDMDYQKKAALLAKQNKAYNDFCEQNDLKRLADRLAIAKWDRQQAAAARGAAQRYKAAKGE